MSVILTFFTYALGVLRTLNQTDSKAPFPDCAIKGKSQGMKDNYNI